MVQPKNKSYTRQFVRIMNTQEIYDQTDEVMQMLDEIKLSTLHLSSKQKLSN